MWKMSQLGNVIFIGSYNWGGLSRGIWLSTLYQFVHHSLSLKMEEIDVAMFDIIPVVIVVKNQAVMSNNIVAGDSW